MIPVKNNSNKEAIRIEMIIETLSAFMTLFLSW